MKNALIGIFSIPASAAIAIAVMLLVYRYGHVGLAAYGYAAMLAAVLAIVANAYAIKDSRRYKNTSVATLAVVLPWISAAISAAWFIWGVRFVAGV